MAEPYKVTVSPEALVELVRAATWWREHRPASPRLFQGELDQVLGLIAEYLEIGTVARSKRVGNARVLQLTRSRYRVFTNCCRSRAKCSSCTCATAAGAH